MSNNNEPETSPHLEVFALQFSSHEPIGPFCNPKLRTTRPPAFKALKGNADCNSAIFTEANLRLTSQRAQTHHTYTILSNENSLYHQFFPFR